MSDFFISNFTPQPAQVEHLILSPLGAWMDVRGEWNSVAAGQTSTFGSGGTSQAKAATSTSASSRMAFSSPPGIQRCVSISTSVSSNPSPSHHRIGGGDSVAYLRKKTFIVVREPERTYPASGQPDGGAQWPFTRVRITTTITPDLETRPSSIPPGTTSTGWASTPSSPTSPASPSPSTSSPPTWTARRSNSPPSWPSSPPPSMPPPSSPPTWPPTMTSWGPAATPPSRAVRRHRPQRRPRRHQRADPDPHPCAAGPDGFVADGDAPFFPLWTSAEVRLPGVEQAKGGPWGRP